MEYNNNIPVFQFLIDEDLDSPLLCISLVDTPAIMATYKYFSNTKLEFTSVDKEKRIITGPVMIPGMRIYRNDQEGEYYGYFSKEDIYKVVQKYFKSGAINSFNLMHDGEAAVNSVYIFESWFTSSENDKSKALGYNLPDGSWMISAKIDNTKEGNIIWEHFIKTGELKGFSVEILINNLKRVYKTECPITEKDVLHAKLKAVILLEENQNTTTEIYVDDCTCSNCRTLKEMGSVPVGTFSTIKKKKNSN